MCSRILSDLQRNPEWRSLLLTRVFQALVEVKEAAKFLGSHRIRRHPARIANRVRVYLVIVLVVVNINEQRIDLSF